MNPSRINFKLRQLALLSALSETGSLRRAAERIHVSQPGATRLLHELEDMLGVELFTRTKGLMQVTAAGEMMISHANELQNRMVNAYMDTQSASHGNAGTLRLGVFGSVDPQLLAHSLSALREQLPRLEIRVVEASQDMLIGAIRRCELDGAIGRLVASQSEPDLHYEVVYTETFSVVCGIANPLIRKRRKPPLIELVDAQWILPPRGTFVRQKIDAYFLATCGRSLTASIESLSLLSYMAFLATTNSLGVLATGVATFLESGRHVRILVPALGAIESPVALLTRADASVRLPMKALLTILKSGGR